MGKKEKESRRIKWKGRKMTRREFLNGPVNEQYVAYHSMLNSINAPQELHELYKCQFMDMLMYVLRCQDYLEDLKKVLEEKYGEEECKELMDIAMERLNISYGNSGVIRDEIREKGSVVVFPGVIWDGNEFIEKEE